MPIVTKLPRFYQEVFIAFNSCKTVRPVVECQPHDTVTDVIWGNERYKYDGKCLYLKTWIKSGILYVKDIIDESGKILCEEKIMQKLEKTTNWIAEYSMVKQACKVLENKRLNFEGTKINILKDLPRIVVNDKSYKIVDVKVGFFYKILRNQKFKAPYMQHVWVKQLNIDCLNFHRYWRNVNVLKIKQVEIKKLAEFNYKILSGTLPCGQLLSKWKKDISAKCCVCKVTEDLKHMLYECAKVKNIWEKLGLVLRVDVKWKHIVIGYFMDQNINTRNVNMICCYVAYSIFKANNHCKWNLLSYNECDVKERVLNDLQHFMKMQAYFKNYIFQTMS